MSSPETKSSAAQYTGIAVALAGALTAFLQAQSAGSAGKIEAAASKARSEVLYEVMRKELTTARSDVVMLKKEARRLSDAFRSLQLEWVASAPAGTRRAARRAIAGSMAPPVNEGTPSFSVAPMFSDDAPSMDEPEPAPLPLKLDALLEAPVGEPPEELKQ